jgi:hypothetical protein
MSAASGLATQIQNLLGIIHSQASGNEGRKAAQVQLDQIIAVHSSLVIPACLVLLGGTGDSLSGHFALSAISKFVVEKGPSMTESEWQGLKAGLLTLFQGADGLPFFLMSKLIDVVCEVAIRTWPNDWKELLPTVLNSNTNWGICLFARICDSLSEDSLSVRCIAPERQLSLRGGIAQVAEVLIEKILEISQASNGGQSLLTQWLIELINGLSVATKQSSFLIKHNLHEVVMQAFLTCSDTTVKMLCVECLSNFIHLLNGQSGRSYTIPRGTREKDSSMLYGILSVCRQLIDPNAMQVYCEQEDVRDSFRAFFDLLTDIRKTSNIFSFFSDLSVFSTTLIDIASTHPSLQVQITALGNIDAMLRAKHLVADRQVLLLCFLACHDFYTTRTIDEAAVPSLSIFPSLGSRSELDRRRKLCVEECEEDDMKPNELIGKLKNVGLLCVRHITTTASSSESLLSFLKEILSEAIKPNVGVTKSYYPALLFTEAVATSLTPTDPKVSEVSKIIDIVTSTCPTGNEQDYLWFISKAGSLISKDCLKSVYETILKMEIGSQFPVQLAFISLCKNNPNSVHYVGGLHQALHQALGGETRSWAIGAILSASAHGGVGAADGFATSVFQDVTGKLNNIAATTAGNLEEFAKRSTPLFATLKAVLEVPLSPSISSQISCELAANLIPFCWTRLLRDPIMFDIGQNEYLSVLGAQFTQSVAPSTASHTNAAFQMYLLLTQVAGLCFGLIPSTSAVSLQPLIALFDPMWELRPSLLNILVLNVSCPASHSRPSIILQSALPAAISTLKHSIGLERTDDFTISSISRASVSIVQCLLNALQISTDDEFAVTEFSGTPKGPLTQKQLKAQLRSRNRFSAISEDALASQSQPVIGHRIPNELLSCPTAALGIVSLCLQFRTDKALRRISQTVPTIITRWWNSVSNDSNLASSFAAALPEYVLNPILALLQIVRAGDPVTLPGGQLHSYTCDRAVSGRRLASELVDHSTISIHGVLSVLWRFASAPRHGNVADPLTVIETSPSLNHAVRMFVSATMLPPSSQIVASIALCAREQSLESRANLKHLVESVVKPEVSSSDSLSGNPSIIKSGIFATSKDLQVIPSRDITTDDDQTPSASFFG